MTDFEAYISRRSFSYTYHLSSWSGTGLPLSAVRVVEIKSTAQADGVSRSMASDGLRLNVFVLVVTSECIHFIAAAEDECAATMTQRGSGSSCRARTSDVIMVPSISAM
jgi:hypothetical protein